MKLKKLKLAIISMISVVIFSLFEMNSLTNIKTAFTSTFTTAETDVEKTNDGFCRYVLSKGLTINNLSDNYFRLSRLNWSCNVNTSIAMNFKRKHISWQDMFETRIEVLNRKTIFSPESLRKKMGVLPKDGTPITLVARQGNLSIPERNVIIRLNNHGPFDARTTMVMTWSRHLKTVTMCAREQPNDEIIRWTHLKPYGSGRNYGKWNTSKPLVVPEDVWGFQNLSYYRGPLFFMKRGYFFGRFAQCNPGDGIGLGALNRVAHLKGNITTLGFSTSIKDKYNRMNRSRFRSLAHKLTWFYFVLKELTDTV